MKPNQKLHGGTKAKVYSSGATPDAATIATDFGADEYPNYIEALGSGSLTVTLSSGDSVVLAGLTPGRGFVLQIKAVTASSTDFLVVKS